jgi:membrane protein CcdC involved in cytochrome C biogenesis
MVHTIPFNFHFITPVIAFVMAATVITLRLRATNKPVNAKKIILPPIGMSTGFLMFLYPPTHIPWSWAALAFLTGALFLSIPLIQTSKFHVVNGEIYLKRSKAFVWILLTLFVLRLSLHSYIEQHISVFQTGSVFFILAFGMLLPWRLAMYVKYKKLQNELKQKSATS